MENALFSKERKQSENQKKTHDKKKDPFLSHLSLSKEGRDSIEV
jgi:hypothetical protein